MLVKREVVMLLLGIEPKPLCSKLKVYKPIKYLTCPISCIMIHGYEIYSILIYPLSDACNLFDFYLIY
jgi:hypothetical protein